MKIFISLSLALWEGFFGPKIRLELTIPNLDDCKGSRNFKISLRSKGLHIHKTLCKLAHNTFKVVHSSWYSSLDLDRCTASGTDRICRAKSLFFWRTTTTTELPQIHPDIHFSGWTVVSDIQPSQYDLIGSCQGVWLLPQTSINAPISGKSIRTLRHILPYEVIEISQVSSSLV